MPSRRQKISVKKIKALEDKITKKVMSNIEGMIAKKCKEFFNKSKIVLLEESAINRDLKSAFFL